MYTIRTIIIGAAEVRSLTEISLRERHDCSSTPPEQERKTMAQQSNGAAQDGQEYRMVRGYSS